MKKSFQVLGIALATVFAFSTTGHVEAFSSSSNKGLNKYMNKQPNRIAAQIQNNNQGTGGNDGGKCTVVSGPNKGKKGTYDDGFCEGDWGATECKTSSGSSNNKCKDGHVKVRIATPWSSSGGYSGWLMKK